MTDLKNLVVTPEEARELRSRAASLRSIRISERSLCDLELLASGAFSPLDRFMGQADYNRVLGELKLANNSFFPVPITLPVDPGSVRLDEEITLCNSRNEPLALMTVEEIYDWNWVDVANELIGTLDERQPLVSEMKASGRINISGPLKVLQLPRHYDFQSIRLSPAETRARLASMGNANVVALQMRHPMDRMQEELLRRAAQETEAGILLQLVAGLAKPGDIEHFARIRSYRVLAEQWSGPSRPVLSLLPMAPRLAGPREVLLQALVAGNYGANHLLHIEEDDRPSHSERVRELGQKHSDELGVKMLPVRKLVYLPDERRYEDASGIQLRERTVAVSAAQAREKYLDCGKRPPQWLMRSDVAEILEEVYPPMHRRGVCIWFTGLSGAGKSTTAEVLTVLLLEHGRQVTVLDGDVVRTHLSKGLGFNKDDRDINIRRIGFVASEIARHGGVVICAAVSPYRETRQDVRNMVGAEQFIEVFVNTPLEVCEQRDAKGMYAKARRGEIRDFTGIDDPYEPPFQPEITLDTVRSTPEENARRILEYLIGEGFVREQDIRTSEPVYASAGGI
jgi:sulfate adenylyltransferase